MEHGKNLTATEVNERNDEYFKNSELNNAMANFETEIVNLAISTIEKFTGDTTLDDHPLRERILKRAFDQVCYPPVLAVTSQQLGASTPEVGETWHRKGGNEDQAEIVEIIPPTSGCNERIKWVEMNGGSTHTTALSWFINNFSCAAVVEGSNTVCDSEEIEFGGQVLRDRGYNEDDYKIKVDKSKRICDW